MKTKDTKKTLTRNEFNVLETLAVQEDGMTQRFISTQTGLSLGTINSIMKKFVERGYVTEGVITNKGLNVLEPYRVKRAVFLAAGFGSRLLPVTLNTPKPLVRIKGKRIIDSILDACVAVGIEDFVIVRGYLGEEFEQLKTKYSNISFINNTRFSETNTIYSAVCARNYLSNAYICEADLFVTNPAIIKKYQYSSNTLGIKTDKTDDWCFITDKDKVIKKQQVGGVDCFLEIGISYIDEEDGKKISEDVVKAFEMPGGKELYWDQPQLDIFKKKYRIEVRECNREDVVEIDTFRELQEIDKTYLTYI